MEEKTILLAWKSYAQHVMPSHPFTRGLYSVAITG